MVGSTVRGVIERVRGIRSYLGYDDREKFEATFNRVTERDIRR